MSNESDLDIDWAAIVDLLASEYGWTIKYIESLNLGQVIALRDKIRERYANQNGEISGNNESMPSDKLSISDFETKLGGKKRIRDDGITEIVI